MRRKENMYGYVFIAPWFVGLCLFLAYPLVYSLTLAFSAITDALTFSTRFVGLANFREALLTDVNFPSYLVSSLLGTVVDTPIVLVFAVFAAILLNRGVKGRALFRSAFLLPVLMGTGAVMGAIRGNSGQVALNAAQAAQMVQNTGLQGVTEMGALDQNLLNLLGPFFSGVLLTVLNRLVSVMWVSGIQIIIFLGALQTIPSSLYEAAFCDGAGEWDKFWFITLPMLAPTVLLNAVYTMIDYFTNTDNKVISYVAQVSFGGTMRLTYGAAVSWLYFAIIGVVLLIIALIARRKGDA